MQVGKLNTQSSNAVDAATVLLLHGDGVNASTAIIDSSSSAKQVTVVASAQISTAKSVFSGSSILFNGSTDYLSIADSSDWAYGTSDFTVEFWANFNSLPTSGNQAFFYLQVNGGNTTQISLFNNTGVQTLVLYDATTGCNIRALWTPVVGTWYHVAVCRVGNSFNFYINGTALTLTTNTPAAIADQSAPLYIGSNAGSSSFSGYIDELRITKGSSRYLSNFSVPPQPFPGRETWYQTQADPLDVLLLHCDGADGGTTFKDSSISGKAITTYGTAKMEASQRKFGTTSLRTDGSSTSYIALADSADWNLGTGPFTLEGWVKLNSLPNIYWTMFCQADTSAQFWAFGYYSGTLRCNYYNSGNVVNFTCPWTPTLGVWYHIAAVRISATDATTHRLFINGVSQPLTLTGGLWTAAFPDLTTQMKIGGDPTAFMVSTDGWFDECRISKGIAKYTTDFTPAIAPYFGSEGPVANPDVNTMLLLHGDGTNASTNIYDSSVSGKAVTVVSGAKISTAQSKFGGSSILLNGSTDCLTLASNSDFDFGGADFTIDCWANWSANTSDSCIIHKYQDGSNYWSFDHYGAGSYNWLFFTFYSNGTVLGQCYTATPGFVPVLGTWYHIAFVRQGSTGYIFVNGVLQNTITNVAFGTMPPINGLTYVGKNQNGNTWFNGYLDEVRVSRGIARWTSNFTPPTSAYFGREEWFANKADPRDVLLLHMDGANGGTTFTDSSLSAKTVTPTGACTTSTADKRFGQSAWLGSGSAQYLSIPANPDFAFGTGDLTIDFWFKRNGAGADPTLEVPISGGVDGNGWELYISPGPNQLSFYNYQGATYMTTSWTVDTGKWHHCAFVRQGTSHKIYIDGVAGTVGTNTLTGTATIGGSASALYIANQYSGNNKCFNGYIDELRITKGLARWTANFTPPTAPYIGREGYVKQADPADVLLLHFDGEDGATDVVDSSVSNKAVTVVGSAHIYRPNLHGMTAGAGISGGGVLALNGTTDYCTLVDSTDWSFGAGDFTLEGWVYLNAININHGVLSQWADVNNGWYMRVNAANQLQVNWVSGGTTLCGYQGGNFAANTWYHVAAVRNGSSFYIFQNGVSQSLTVNQAVGTNNVGDVASVLNIGIQQPSSAFMSGMIDELKITKGIARYTSNFTPPTTKYIGREDVLGRTTAIPGFVEVLDFTATGTESSVSVAVDGDTDEEYRVMAYTYGTGVFKTNLNNDSAANYGYQYIFNNAGTITSALLAGATAFLQGANPCYTECVILAPMGMLKTLFQPEIRSVSGTTVGATVLWGSTYNSTANVTSLNFSNFVAGTRIIVYAKRGI